MAGVRASAMTLASSDDADFQALLRKKLRTIAPMFVVYIVAYLGLSTLAGFARPLLGEKVAGAANLGFAIILGNYLLAWALAIAYALITAKEHDPLVARLRRRLGHTGDDA